MTHTEAVNSQATERYLLDEMSEPERDAFEAHFFECGECADDVTVAARLREGVASGLLQPRQGARVAAFTPVPKKTADAQAVAVLAKPMAVAPATVLAQARAWYQSAALPWAVAATLAVMVGYQAQQDGEESPVSGTAATAVTPALLRPSSRGAVPTVSLGAPHAALALDVDAAGATEVAFDLRDAAGAVISSGRAPAPAAGTPLLVVIPSFTLKGEQRYSLTVRDAAQEARSLGDYTFSTTP